MANMDSSEVLSDVLDPKKEDDDMPNSNMDKSCLNATNIGNSLKSGSDLVDELSSRKRKREGYSKMLNWLINVAKDPCSLELGELPKFSKWKNYGDEKPWKQVLLSREMMCVKSYPNSQKRNSMYPSMYKEAPERVRSSRRVIPTKKHSSYARAPSESSSCTRSDIEDNLGKNTQSFSAGSKFYFLRDRDRSKRVPVGPNHQTHIPTWTQETYECDSNWLGSRVWPLESGERRALVEKERTGKGRQESCGCPNQGSVECVRFHVSEKKNRVKLELGPAFSRWEFNKMGEEMALSWTKEDEERFQEIIRSNPPSSGVRFWDKIMEAFPSKNREQLVSYFFNVFLLRRRSYQNRSTPNKIDSDDEDLEFRSLSDGKNETGKCPSSIFYSPKKLRLSS